MEENKYRHFFQPTISLAQLYFPKQITGVSSCTHPVLLSGQLKPSKWRLEPFFLIFGLQGKNFDSQG
jgi:hypothetical protein